MSLIIIEMCDTIANDCCLFMRLITNFMRSFSIESMRIISIILKEMEYFKSFTIHRRNHIFTMKQSHIEGFIGKLYIHFKILVAFAMKKMILLKNSS